MKLYSAETIRDLRDRYGFKFTKSLGQNFLTDKNIIDSIIDSAGITKEDLVIEIGPGIGVLTKEACELAGKVVAIEIDKNLIPILSETLAEYDNVEIVNCDVLKTDINKIIDETRIDGKKPAHVRILGNLPYYITTPIVMKLFEDGVHADSITVMMQKEVADRIMAHPSTKAYGALSCAVQYYSTVNFVAKAPKEAFVPQPTVDSEVLRLDIIKEKAISTSDEKVFFACVKAGFGQRRKTLSNSLTGVCGLEKEEVLSALESAGIDPQRRAETLDLTEFGRLSDVVALMLKEKQ